MMQTVKPFETQTLQVVVLSICLVCKTSNYPRDSGHIQEHPACQSYWDCGRNNITGLNGCFGKKNPKQAGQESGGGLEG